jgi:NSS family neurotransmitter:Na+ symporter
MVNDPQPQATQRWGSKLGVILAVAGSAVGLGNFLRFPGNAAANGGGAFMIPYFISFILLGIPIGWAEWAMGRYGGQKGFHSAPAIFGVWGKGAIARYLGAFAVLIPLAVYFYYAMIEAWCLRYAVEYAMGGIGIDSAATVADQVASSRSFLGDVTGASANGAAISGTTIGFWIVTTALNVYFVYAGLSKGIERFCSFAMPAMGVIGIVVLIRVLTLPSNGPGQSVLDGLNFMWNPDFTALANPRTWLAAAGQIFFSLSVGFGVIVNYASYMRKKDDVVLSGLTASATNEFFEVALGGMITLTAAVVFMGVTATAANTGGTFSTGFHALPVVFASMPLGNVFGALWFFMLFLAAITSSLSMLQPSKAFFQEALAVDNKAATTIVTGIALVGNICILYFSHDLVLLDTVDFWVGTFLIFVVAGTQLIVFGWVTGVDVGFKEAHVGARIRIPAAYRFIIRYISPVYLFTIFGLFCYYQLPDYVRAVVGNEAEGIAPNTSALLGWALILGTLAILLVTTHIGARRWRAQGLDLDGLKPAPETESE